MYLLFMSLGTLPAEDGHGPTDCNQSPTFLFDAELGHLSALVPTVPEDRWLFRHHQAGTVLFLGGRGSSIFSSSKIFPYFAQAQSSSLRPRHEPPQLRAQNRTMANGWHCKEVASLAISHHAGISTAQGTAAPSLACVHFTSTSLSPSCEATR